MGLSHRQAISSRDFADSLTAQRPLLSGPAKARINVNNFFCVFRTYVYRAGTSPAAMTEVSIAPEVWARLAHAWDGSLTSTATILVIVTASLLAAKVRGGVCPVKTQTCYNAG